MSCHEILITVHYCCGDKPLLTISEIIEFVNFKNIIFILKEQKKTKRLEESKRRLDDERKRADQLLYQMMPQPVADRLRSGEHPLATCEVTSRNKCSNKQIMR